MLTFTFQAIQFGFQFPNPNPESFNLAHCAVRPRDQPYRERYRNSDNENGDEGDAGFHSIVSGDVETWIFAHCVRRRLFWQAVNYITDVL
jgi:hypothetical protein